MMPSTTTMHPTSMPSTSITTMTSTSQSNPTMPSTDPTTIPELTSPVLTHIAQSTILHDLYAALIRSFLDRGLTRSALFHAERFFALTNNNNNSNGGNWEPPPSSSLASSALNTPSSSNATPSSSNTPTNHPNTHAHAPPHAAHSSRHLYALSLLFLDQTYSALSLVNGPNSLVNTTGPIDQQQLQQQQNGLIDLNQSLYKQQVCKGCLEIKARCCVKLGRWRQAREALESVGLESVTGGVFGVEGSAELVFSSSSSDPSASLSLPNLQCKAGIAALHGNMPHKAAQSFREALSADPLMWEAWEGLCAVGDPPDVENIFPPRPLPIKRGPSQSHTHPSGHSQPHNHTHITIPTFTSAQAEDSTSTSSTHTSSYTNTTNTTNTNGTTTTTTSSTKPTATGAGFFSPDHSTAAVPGLETSMEVGNLFHPLRHEMRSLRMAPRDSIASESSFYTEPSFLQQRQNSRTQSQPPDLSHSSTSNTHLQPTTTGTGTATSRPLSSADESGPVAKRLRSQMGGVDATATPVNTVANAAGNLKTRAGKGTVAEGGSSSNATVIVNGNTGNHPSNANNATTNNNALMKKPRPRQALTYANVIPSSGGRASSQASSRSGSGGSNSGAGKSNANVNGQTQGVVTRRSSRLLSGVVAGAAGGGGVKVGLKMRKRQVTAVPKSIEKDEADEEEETWTAAQEQQAQQVYEDSLAQYYIYTLTRTFALALFHLSTFSCSQCLSTLSVLPASHQSTSLSLSLIARAHYEVQDYRSSERAFKALRWKEKYRVWDMEVYSSLLWQMGREVELAFLAREMVDLAPGCGEAWIVVGNLFSVRKERERALGCFRRAGELAAKGSVKAYAYTLCGHESVDEDLASAIRYFERALRVDGGRHYNAWYGLGTCYLRMGKVRMAEYHFRRAVGVNGGSAVLLGCVGLAVERRGWVGGTSGGGEKGEGGGLEEALGWFERAVSVSEGRNALVRFRRAKIYVKLRRYQEAIEDLEYLKNVTPDESNVIFQLAKVYRLVGDVVKSAQMLAAARDVSPKSVNKIRRLVDVEADGGDREMEIDES